jgi:hypothetical protein
LAPKERLMNATKTSTQLRNWQIST